MTSAFAPNLAQKIEAHGIIAVLIIDREDDAVPLAKSLFAGGIQVIELTLRTPVALEAIRRIRAEVPEMTVGAGTILTPAQLRDAARAGAAFGVSPGVNRHVLEAARAEEFSFAPGVATPSDIETALEYGCRLLKFFPSEAFGGLSTLRVMSAPYAHLGLRFIPLGGIHAGNMASYLADPLVAALGGSWLAPREAIQACDWEKITQLGRDAMEVVRSTPR